MTAIADYAAYKTLVENPHQRMRQSVAIPGTSALIRASMWTISPFFGIAPTTAVVPTSATVGAIAFANSSAEQFLGRAYMSNANISTWLLCDRLSHSGGLDGTVTSAQTTNLPTAALTRYTSGVGVFAALEIYTAVGATVTTVTGSYTNQAGTAGRTFDSTTFGGTGNREATKTIWLGLQAGDTGVKSVESVTLAGTTAGVGNFGVTLFRPICMYAVPSADPVVIDPVLAMGGHMPQVFDNACLFWITYMTGNTIGPHMVGLSLIEP